MTRGRHLFIYDACFMQLLGTRWQPSMTSLTCPPAIFVSYLYSKLNFFILSISEDKQVFQHKIENLVLPISLILKMLPIICSRRQLKFCRLFKNNK